MRIGLKTKLEANVLIESMRKNGVATFHQDTFGLDDRHAVECMVKYAKALHRIAEHDCNGTKTPKMISQEKNTEKKITDIANKFGLKVNFDGDPRGFIVKLHAPLGNVYNTWGGAETGYGIGENE